jgi:predicted dehydrogenase
VSPTSYAIVGSGYRSSYFLRIARALPERFRVAGVVTRTAERGAEVTAEWGVPTFRTLDDLIAADRPEFAIISVPWSVTPDAIRESVALGIPVLAETPPAPDLDGLRALWADVGAGGLVQVAEQYLLDPPYAAALAVVRDGVIGRPTSVQLSSTQLYHAVSVIRGLLGIGFEPAEVSARAFVAPAANPSTRGGWTGGTTPQDLTTTLATIDFGGRMGLYDYTDNQWRNPIRTNRLVVRGSLGEIVDNEVIRMLDGSTPVQSPFLRRHTAGDITVAGLDLEHVSLDGKPVYRNPYNGALFPDDDIAVAALVEQTGAWCRDEGPAPYPLADACQDHQIGLAIGESVATGKPVVTSTEAWAK